MPDGVADRIVSEYRKGTALQQIADHLTADGVATSQGGQRWYASTVRQALRRLGVQTRARGPREGRSSRPDKGMAP